MSSVCEKIESLTLRDTYFPAITHREVSALDSTLAVTTTMLPLLRSLIIDYEVRHLTITNGGIREMIMT
ncbi:hypothetical protein E8E12_003057 [Didymella heteroderae]|uniref:Uncharacterized protein n=1 Tax=Didymella heteroderae TaxID=1769908 RepID=A0A9P4WRT4_9PLEO|nr:hypothetical protein E8E12_003057 [Didymella heteroderae]